MHSFISLDYVQSLTKKHNVRYLRDINNSNMFLINSTA